MTNTTTPARPEALRLADLLRLQAVYHREVASDCDMRAEDTINWGHGEVCDRAASELRRLHAYCRELEAQVILDCMTHVQNPAEIEHVAGDVSKNGAESNMAQQPAPSEQQPFGWIKQSEIDSSNDFGGSINLWRRKYDCDVPVYLAPQPSPTPQADSQPAPVLDYPPLPEQVAWRDSVEHCDLYWRPAVQAQNDLEPLFTKQQMRAYVDADRAARAPADSVLEDAARWQAVEAMIEDVSGGDGHMVIVMTRNAKPEPFLQRFLADKIDVLRAARKQGGAT